MKIVPVSEIPKLEDIKDVPTGNLLEVYKVCKQMEVICDMEEGIGLSAVQVGVPWKLFLVRLGHSPKFKPIERYGYFVNCQYSTISAEDKIASLEGCLSLRSPDGRTRMFQVPRYKNVKIEGFQLTDRNGLKLEEISVELVLPNDKEAIVFQHEIDHHRGVLISDNDNKELFLW